ncbi:hypothetical protein Pcinc_042559 [Petrolisthes cinctipes]|uniref:Uncharacterized protein n=1 Tax=Petrolisthes cinctipes TaxID=88211 RepID=A0AAE1BI59_PETCI|nr:hypothetical protein Pcinc_042559 [Petrolisthes cinctipes]
MPCLYHQQPPQAHSFVTSLNENTITGGRCRGSDTLSIRSVVSRRVSKASSTASPMPPRDMTITSSPRLPSGWMKKEPSIYSKH